MTEWIGLATVIVPTLAVIAAAVIQHRVNRAAHSEIGRRIDGVDARAERRAEAFERRMDAQGEALHAIARDLAFLAGRQTERDHRP